MVGSGIFTGAYEQNQANTSARPTISILSGAAVSNPGTQGWFLTNSGSDSSFYSGQIEFNQGGFTNMGSINCTNTTMPASSDLVTFDSFVHSMPSGSGRNFYRGAGVLGWSYNSGTHGPSTFVNGSAANGSATINSIIIGSGQSTAYGLYAEGRYGPSSDYNIGIDNFGTINGAVQNVDGSAAGIYAYCNSGGITFTNHFSGKATATADYYTTAIYANANNGSIAALNVGNATANSTGVPSGTYAGQSYSVGVDLFTYAGNIAFNNNYGTISGTSSGSGENVAYGYFGWAQGGSGVGGALTFTNTGTITATSSSSGGAKAIYCGGNGGDVSVQNSGTIRGTGGSGWGLGIEEDTGQQVTVVNTGSITHNNGLGLFLYSTAHDTATVINTASGSISGGNEGIAAESFTGPITIYNYGNVISGGSTHNAMDLGSSNDVVHIFGLPTITGTINGAGGVNTLDLQLNGTLQTVNGQTATLGNDLSAYNLGTSGNIVVSGLTYKWSQFNVSGYINNLPSPWTTLDIGAVAARGNASYSSGTFTVKGSGSDIAGNSDEFRYVSQLSTGDCTIQARVASVGNTSSYAKAGVMIRESMDPASTFAMVAVTPSQGIVFECRTSTGAWHASAWATGLKAPYWVKAVRSGSTFTGYYSADGSTWTQLGSQTINMSSSAYIGMAVTSHNDGTLCTGTFTNVTPTP